MARPKGDFARLFVAHRGMLSAYVMCMVRDPDATEDILQDVAAHLLEQFDTFDGQDFGAWSRQVARWFVYNHWRKESRQRKALDGMLSERAMALMSEPFGSEDAGVWDSWESWKRALQECRSKLPSNSSDILNLRYAHGLKVQEIARKLGKQLGAVQVALGRIRERLSECVRRRIGMPEGTA